MRVRPSLLTLWLALVSSLALPRTAGAKLLTFHLSASDALASVARYNTFVASLGTRARRVKLVPGGTQFADQTCAAIGDVYQLGAVTVLDGPEVLPQLVVSHRGRDGTALEAVFQAAGVVRWTPPPAEAETDVPFWAAAPALHG
ncbi:MAG: hypothetical protein ACREQL_02470, partial [Candidatus Binatia bacterium]